MALEGFKQILPTSLKDGTFKPLYRADNGMSTTSLGLLVAKNFLTQEQLIEAQKLANELRKKRALN